MTDNSKVWVWDLYPLQDDACGNARVSIREGDPLELREKRTDRPRRRLSTGEWVEQERPVRRKGYRPTAADLETLRRLMPGCDPENPSWAGIEAKLVVDGGHTILELRGMGAPTLVRKLDKALSNDQAPRERAKGGRPGLSETQKKYRYDVAAGWEQAKAAGVSQRAFARDNNMAPHKLEVILNWCRKDRQRTDATV